MESWNAAILEEWNHQNSYSSEFNRESFPELPFHRIRDIKKKILIFDKF